MTIGDGIRPCIDASEMSWIAPALRPFADGVGSWVPPVFEAYARLLHPAKGPHHSPIRWAEVAAWSGGTIHALVQWVPMARERGSAPSAPPFLAAPADGKLLPATLGALCDVLAGYTTTPGECYFGVWEGWGLLPDEVKRAARLDLPERGHFMFRGALSDVQEIGSDFGGFFRQQSPSIMFPADRSWFVATEVDFDSTYVGGSRELIGAIVADERLEAWPVSATDPTDAGSDPINRFA
jgi:hypothetical protein